MRKSLFGVFGIALVFLVFSQTREVRAGAELVFASETELMRSGAITTTAKTISFETDEEPGTIIIDTDGANLYLVLEDGKAIFYRIGVGRPGFEWAGTHRVSRKAEWPSWRPPAEMRQRQPYLPRFVPGGEFNPLGARALYLGSTLYRIHGTTEPETIGYAVSSGCIRMLNEDVIDLYERVPVGAKVIVS
jgi:lipoprotein-anchoring transpeptidase ErfK/SrfK